MNTIDENRYALVYTRVSSKSQKAEGSGDASQEVRCIEYAKQKGYIYERTFEDVFTGGGNYLYRKGMMELLKHIEINKERHFVVIFDDLKRFARDVKFHIKLREELNTRKALLDSPNFHFDNSPEGEANELHAAVSNQLERKQNQRQVIQKQTARLTDGYWPFVAPLGYSMRKVEGFGKMLFPNEKARTIKEALEGFSISRFQKKLDVAIYLQERNVVGKQHPEKYFKTVTKLLSKVVYAGYIEYPDRGIARRKGKHEAIISLETFDRIQKRLKKEDGTRVRMDIRDDFPIRGLVDCAECGNKITGGLSSGRNKRYAYYNCCKPGCSKKGLTIKKEHIETEFAQLLKSVEVTNETAAYAISIFDDAWATEMANRGTQSEISKVEIQSCNQEIASLIDLVCKVQSEIVRNQYERRIELLGLRVQELQNELNEKPIQYHVSFRTALSKVLSLLKTPYNVWISAPVDHKHKLYHFLFENRLAYAKNEGFRTAKYSIGVRALENFAIAKTGDVEIDQNTLHQFRNYIYKFYFFLEESKPLSIP